MSTSSPSAPLPRGQTKQSFFGQQLRDLRATVALVYRASRAQFFVMSVLTLVSALQPAATLYASKLLLDAVANTLKGPLDGSAFGPLVFLLGLQVGIGALGVVVNGFINSSRELLGDSLQQHITKLILEKASGLEVERFENAQTYDALRNAYNEVGFRPMFVVTNILSLAQAVVTLGSIGVLIAQLGWLPLLLVFVASIPGMLVSNRFNRENYFMMRRRANEARMQNYLGQVLTSDQLIKEVRLFNTESYLLERWRMFYQQFRAQLERLVKQRNLWSTLAALGSTGLMMVATLPILARVAQGQVSVGDFSLFTLGLAQVQNTFANLIGGLGNLSQNLLYMRNLFEFLELPVRDLDAGEEWKGSIHTIEFEHVSFRYPLTNKNVLEDVSFQVSRGEAIALVGENGAGKTTIVKLLARLFEPTDGRILINGLPAARFSPRSMQREISAILQDFGQYQLSVRENVAFSSLEHMQDESRLQTKLEQAGVDFIEGFERGVETQLGRLFAGGQQLSGGQWQRLALARLYYRNASVLIFDEPTAALDARAEAQAMEELRAGAKDAIVLLISHRFSTVRLANTILVLEDGRISEVGSHTELMEHGGTYATLYTLQAKGFLNP